MPLARGKQGENRSNQPFRRDIQEFGFLLTPGFAPLGFFAALEVLQTANRVIDQFYYGWHIYYVDGSPITESNRVLIVADLSIAKAEDPDQIFVCAGFEPRRSTDTKTLAW